MVELKPKAQRVRLGDRRGTPIVPRLPYFPPSVRKPESPTTGVKPENGVRLFHLQLTPDCSGFVCPRSSSFSPAVCSIQALVQLSRWLSLSSSLFIYLFGRLWWRTLDNIPVPSTASAPAALGSKNTAKLGFPFTTHEYTQCCTLEGALLLLQLWQFPRTQHDLPGLPAQIIRLKIRITGCPLLPEQAAQERSNQLESNQEQCL